MVYIDDIYWISTSPRTQHCCRSIDEHCCCILLHSFWSIWYNTSGRCNSKHEHNIVFLSCTVLNRFANANRQSQISLWIQPHIKVHVMGLAWVSSSGKPVMTYRLLYLQCYSKFGDVVFTLTRFFRDGAIHGPTKLELAPTEDHGICQLKKL